MLLNVFNKLMNITKENDTIQNFIKEMGEFIKNEPQNNTKNEQSLIQKLLEQNKLTVEYRDKMHIARADILNNYAKQTADKGEMYYIYNKDYDTYHLSMCNEENSHKVIKVKEKDLPEGTKVDSVLRKENGKYTIDNVATREVYSKMEKMTEDLLQEQKEIMEKHRIEGHLYELVENSKNNIWLIDKSIYNDTGECFEELTFEKEIFENAKQGDLFQYVDGKYVKYNE